MNVGVLGVLYGYVTNCSCLSSIQAESKFPLQTLRIYSGDEDGYVLYRNISPFPATTKTLPHHM